MGEIKVVLSGGPESFPMVRRVHLADSLESSIKFPFGAGYEHFRHIGDFTSMDGETLPVFTWFDRTAIAE
jgi:hypothetical protein